jgi:hypothetical protein
MIAKHSVMVIPADINFKRQSGRIQHSRFRAPVMGPWHPHPSGHQDRPIGYPICNRVIIWLCAPSGLDFFDVRIIFIFKVSRTEPYDPKLTLTFCLVWLKYGRQYTLDAIRSHCCCLQVPAGMHRKSSTDCTAQPPGSLKRE